MDRFQWPVRVQVWMSGMDWLIDTNTTSVRRRSILKNPFDLIMWLMITVLRPSLAHRNHEATCDQRTLLNLLIFPAVTLYEAETPDVQKAAPCAENRHIRCFDSCPALSVYWQYTLVNLLSVWCMVRGEAFLQISDEKVDIDIGLFWLLGWEHNIHRLTTSPHRNVYPHL